MNPQRSIALLVACLFVPSCVTAQAISGRLVLDSSGTPASRAVVVLISDSARVVAETHADEQGIFGLRSEQPGSYRLGFFLGSHNALVSPAFALDTGAYLEREFRVPASIAAMWDIWLPSEVTKEAMAKPRQPAPAYPTARALQGARGTVRVLFVVNEKGAPEMETVQVIGASDEAFIEPVLQTLKRSRFNAAERNGRAVAQLVQRTYDFGCLGDADRGDVVVRALTDGCKQR